MSILERAAFQDYLRGLESSFGLPEGLLTAVAKTESGGNPNAKSKAGALGLFQIMPETAQELGVDPRNPKQAAFGAAKYLRQQLDQNDNHLPTALAAYNAGPGRVEEFKSTGELPKETRDYIPKIMKALSSMSSISEAQASGEVTDPEVLKAFGMESKIAPEPKKDDQGLKPVTDPEVLKAFGIKPESQGLELEAPQYQKQRILPQEEKLLPEGSRRELSPLEKISETGTEFASGIASSLKGRALGTAQLGVDILSATPGAEGEQELQKARSELAGKVSQLETEQANLPTAGKVGRAVGEVAQAVALPAAQAPLAAAGLGALYGATEPLPEGRSRLLETAKGASLSGVSQVALNRLTKGGTQETADLIAEARKRGIRLSTGDITGGTARKIENTLENVPLVGTAGFRERQLEQAETAAKDIIGKYKPLVDDLPETIQAGLTKTLKKFQKVANDRLSSIAKTADTKGNIPLNKTMQTFSNLLEEEGKSIAPDTALIRSLENWRSRINPETSKGVVTNFSEAIKFRSLIGNYIEDYFQGKRSVIGAGGVHKLEQIRKAVDEDIDNFLQSSGLSKELKNWRQYNKFYSERIAPYIESTTLRNAVNNEEPQRVLKTLITAGPERAKILYRNLDDTGKMAAKAGYLESALEHAIGKEGFDPAAYVTFVKKHSNSAGIIFTQSEKAQVEGLAKVFAALPSRLSQEPARRTGKSVLMAAEFGGAILDPMATAQLASSAFLVKSLLTSKTSVKMLERLSKLKAGSPEEKALASRIIQTGIRLSLGD